MHTVEARLGVDHLADNRCRLIFVGTNDQRLTTHCAVEQALGTQQLDGGDL